MRARDATRTVHPLQVSGVAGIFLIALVVLHRRLQRALTGNHDLTRPL